MDQNLQSLSCICVFSGENQKTILSQLCCEILISNCQWQQELQKTKKLIKTANVFEINNIVVDCKVLLFSCKGKQIGLFFRSSPQNRISVLCCRNIIYFCIVNNLIIVGTFVFHTLHRKIMLQPIITCKTT